MSVAPVTVRRFRAPGKLMLAGEYAVLGPDGEALALAIELGVELEARPSGRWELGRAESERRWRPGEAVPEELRFAHAAWEEALGEGAPSPHTLLTRGFGSAGGEASKLGVGGSASASVVVTAAVRALAGGTLEGPGRERTLELALHAHRRAQGGQGSGYDVATSTLGGVVRFRPARPGGRAEASRLAWPDSLQIVAGFSGRSAPTGQLLSRVAGAAGPASLERDLDGLGEPVRALIEAFQRGDSAGVLEGVRASQRALRDWDRRRALGLLTGELERLIALAEVAGAACKISGAGGGDSVIALAEDRPRLERVARRWRAEGFLAFWPPLSPRGVREL